MQKPALLSINNIAKLLICIPIALMTMFMIAQSAGYLSRLPPAIAGPTVHKSDGEVIAYFPAKTGAGRDVVIIKDPSTGETRKRIFPISITTFANSTECSHVEWDQNYFTEWNVVVYLK